MLYEPWSNDIVAIEATQCKKLIRRRRTMCCVFGNGRMPILQIEASEKYEMLGFDRTAGLRENEVFNCIVVTL
jgi:hypothetical protein